MNTVVPARGRERESANHLLRGRIPRTRCSKTFSNFLSKRFHTMSNRPRNALPDFQLPPSLQDILTVGVHSMKRNSENFEDEDEQDEPGFSRKAPKPNQQSFDPKGTKFELNLKIPIKWNYPSYNYESKREGVAHGNIPIIDDSRVPHPKLSYQAAILYENAKPTQFIGTLDAIVRQLATSTVAGKTILDMDLFTTVLETLSDIVFKATAFLSADIETVKGYLPNLQASIRSTGLRASSVESILSDLENNRGEVTLETLAFVFNAISKISDKYNVEGLIEELVDMEIDEQRVFELWFQIESILSTLTSYDHWPPQYKSEVESYLYGIVDATNFKYETTTFYAAQLSDPRIQNMMDSQIED